MCVRHKCLIFLSNKVGKNIIRIRVQVCVDGTIRVMVFSNGTENVGVHGAMGQDQPQTTLKVLFSFSNEF